MVMLLSNQMYLVCQYCVDLLSIYSFQHVDIILPTAWNVTHSMLQCWPYYMSWYHTITTCVNNTSCNQPKVVQEPEIQAPRGTERQHGVGDTQAA